MTLGAASFLLAFLGSPPWLSALSPLIMLLVTLTATPTLTPTSVSAATPMMMNFIMPFFLGGGAFTSSASSSSLSRFFSALAIADLHVRLRGDQQWPCHELFEISSCYNKELVKGAAHGGVSLTAVRHRTQ